MDIKSINQGLVGKRVKGVFTAMNVTGTISEIIEDKYSIGVKITLDQPVNWGGDLYYNYVSTSRKCDGWGNLQHTELI